MKLGRAPAMAITRVGPWTGPVFALLRSFVMSTASRMPALVRHGDCARLRSRGRASGRSPSWDAKRSRPSNHHRESRPCEYRLSMEAWRGFWFLGPSPSVAGQARHPTDSAAAWGENLSQNRGVLEIRRVGEQPPAQARRVARARGRVQAHQGDRQASRRPIPGPSPKPSLCEAGCGPDAASPDQGGPVSASLASR